MSQKSLTSLKGILWSRKPSSLDLKKDKIYIIHQVLAYGSLEQLQLLFKLYPKKEVIQVFKDSPKRTYTPPAFNFIKNYILGLEKKKLNQDLYVKAIS